MVDEIREAARGGDQRLLLDLESVRHPPRLMRALRSAMAHLDDAEDARAGKMPPKTERH